MFAAAIALAVGPMGKGLPASSLAGRYAGPFRTPAGTRKVAQDKRDATKRRNVLRHRASA